MGICASAPADPAASGKTATINTALAKEQYASEQEIKVLFLGALACHATSSSSAVSHRTVRS